MPITPNSGFSTDNVRTVFQDREDNFWFGTYGEGISMLTSYAFGYYMPGENSLRNNILYVTDYGNNYLLGNSSGFHIFDAFDGQIGFIHRPVGTCRTMPR